jgi:hypothetical protein
MPSIQDLETYLGKDINEICGNGFHDPAANHCAHFVSHVEGLTFSFNCRQFVGGSKTPANIRVHEVFAQCPRVGFWSNADLSKRQLVFVTRKDVVNVATKTMQNIPQKHIGIYVDGFVYHYSNGQDRVVRQTVDDFYDRFQSIYAGDQGLFFGDIPSSDLLLTVDVSAESLDKPYVFELKKSGPRWTARRSDITGSEEFYVGSEILDAAKKFFGIFHPVSKYYGPTFDAPNATALLDQWAYLLDVTAFCESKLRFNLINTYDRARFTFGFYQLAAHTPDDNLILFFRAALNDPEFRLLFPDLALRGEKVFRVASDGTATDLEEQFFDEQSGEWQIKRFMTYLNPNRTEIDEQEVLQAARVIWWANNSETCRNLQTIVAGNILQSKMSDRYAQWYDLDGQLDIVCAIIADIHHQGRGTKTAVRNALKATNPTKALLAVGGASDPVRVATLEKRINKWVSAGKLATKRYRAALNEFD